nr:2,3-bisphosphoglycerate-independent phosphoglycerate mutase [Arachidicoccus ginsenosidivorans]
MQAKKAILLIMDGWGLGKSKQIDAIQAANTPFVDALYDKYPHTTLVTYGESVGLPDGQMGNSEVGHLNLGAGRIVYQELQRINVAIRENEFHKNPTLLAAIQKAKSTQKPLHLLGLVSNGGVHSHINHLKAIIDVCKQEDFKNVFIHAFTDGRDCDPHSGKGFIQDLLAHLAGTGVGQIASITGRYYAMDRDKRWERVKLAYDAIVHGTGELATDLVAAIDASYQNEVTDEFIKPIINQQLQDNPDSKISDGDVAICFNFRTDRCREITQVLTQEDFPDFGMKKLDIDYTTMTQYNKDFKGVHIIFQNEDLNNTIGEVLASNGKKQIRIAETENIHTSPFSSVVGVRKNLKEKNA